MKTYIKFSFLFLFVLNSYVYSQDTTDYVFITGQLTLGESDPAAFAHIYIKNKNMGGITDINGEFSFNLPAKYMSDTIVATYVGYNDREIPISELLESNDKTHALSVKAITLNEVTVFAPSQVLKEAIKGLAAKQNENNYHIRKGILYFSRQEDEDFTLYEEIAFNLHYRGKVENPYGFEPTEHRRTVDHSRFPFVSAGERRNYGINWIFGISIERYIQNLFVNMDSATLNISDIAMINDVKHLVISHKAANSVEYFLYVRESDNHLAQIQYSTNSSQVGMFIGGSPFSNSVYKEYRYRMKNTFHFGEKNSPHTIERIVMEDYSQIIEKLTGRIIHNYSNKREVVFSDFLPIEEQSNKHENELSLPLRGLKYNPEFWNNLKGHEIALPIRKSLSQWGSLESQFESTDGGVELDRRLGKTTFNKKDQRKQTKTESTEKFIDDLKNNRYVAGYPPTLDWEDIPALMAIANNTTVIDRFPRNILSRIYVDRCQVGIVAMWLIDSIRKNEGRKPRKAWYISPTPLLENENDRERSRSRSGQYIPHNSEEKLKEAFEAFSSWWETAQQLGPGKAKRLNPLEGSELNWVYHD